MILFPVRHQREHDYYEIAVFIRLTSLLGFNKLAATLNLLPLQYPLLEHQNLSCVTPDLPCEASDVFIKRILSCRLDVMI